MANSKKTRRDSARNPRGKAASLVDDTGSKRAADVGALLTSKPAMDARLQKYQQQMQSNANREIDIKARMREALTQFVSAEIDLGLTFCDMAASSRDSDAADRRMERAMEAHESAEHYLQELDVSANVKSGIEKKLTALKKSLNKVQSSKRD